MSATDSTERATNRPDEVLTFGGSSRTYHRVHERDGDVHAGCGQSGRNPLVKDRSVIESHYEPCSRCFPEGDR